ncbi:Uncharacterised protein [Bacteroides xylanisolvens]|nr:Uncharacterised protein [Bacteroides xylanisolvens]
MICLTIFFQENTDARSRQKQTEEGKRPPYPSKHDTCGADQRPRFLFCDRSAIQNLFRPLQNLFAAAFHFLNPPAAWPGLAFVIAYVSYVIELFVFDNGNISMNLLIVTGYLGNRK